MDPASRSHVAHILTSACRRILTYEVARKLHGGVRPFHQSQAINLGALCGTNLVTLRWKFRANGTLVLHRAVVEHSQVLSHTMHQSNGFRKSTPLQNHQRIVNYY